jgi:O-antigen/teichoic acid export membrane protein
LGIVIKQGIQTTIASYIGVLLGFLNFFLLFPLLLTPEQIGLMRLMEESTSLLATLAMAGAPNICIRFFPFFKDEERAHGGFLWLMLLMPTLGILAAAALLFLFQNPLQKAYRDAPLMLQYWHYILPITAFTMFFLTIETYAKSNFFAAIPTFFKEGAKRIIIIIASVLMWYKMLDFAGLMQWFWVSHLLILFFLVAYMWKIGLWQLAETPFKRITTAMRSEMLSFSFYITLGNFGGLFISKIDTLMLGAMVGLQDTGIYGMAAKLIMLIDLPRNAIQQVVMPLLAKAYKENDLEAVQSLYKKTALNQLIIGFLLLLLLWGGSHAIFAIIPNGEIYKSGINVLLFLGIAKVIDMGAGVNYEILAFSKYYRISAYLNLVLTAISVFINLFFIQKYGFVGASVAIIFIIILFNTVRGGVLYYLMGLQPFSPNALKVVLLGAIVFGIDALIPHFDSSRLVAIADGALHSIVILSVFMGAVLYFRLSEDISNSFEKNMKRFF